VNFEVGYQVGEWPWVKRAVKKESGQRIQIAVGIELVQ
jgi:hypothetical protein